MTTSPGPATKNFPESSLEKKVYNAVEKYKEYLPVENDRYRLSFGLYKYLQGEGDPPKTLVKSAKIKIQGISSEELANKLNSEIEKIK